MNDKKQELAQKTELAVKMPDPARGLISMMESLKPQFAKVLPKHVTVDRMVRTALTCVRQNPDLLKCNPESFIGALFSASQVGLEPGGPLGLSYLIPYRRKDGNYECQYQISYKGLKELCHRSGQVDFIGAYAIRKNDEFDLCYGSGGKFSFKPNLSSKNDENNPVICYVSFIKYKSGAESYIHMTPDEVLRVRDKYSKTANSSFSPWNTEPEEMALKTVIKKHLKKERLSPEQQVAVEREETTQKVNMSVSEKEIYEVDDFVQLEKDLQESEKKYLEEGQKN